MSLTEILKKIIRKVLKILFYILLMLIILLLCTFLYLFYFVEVGSRDIIRTSISPDKKLKAVLTLESCPTVRLTSSVYVMRVEDELPHGRRAVFMSYLSDNIKIRWKDNKNLTINYPKETEVVRFKNSWHFTSFDNFFPRRYVVNIHLEKQEL